MTLQPGTFLTVSHKIMGSPRFKKLSPYAKVAYFVLKHAYNGHNNGNILMSSRMMAQRINCSSHKAAEARIELIGGRFIEMTADYIRGDKPHARTYRLLEHKCDVSGMRAGDASVMPAKRRATK
jgi:hypothetical protein